MTMLSAAFYFTQIVEAANNSELNYGINDRFNLEFLEALINSWRFSGKSIMVSGPEL